MKIILHWRSKVLTDFTKMKYRYVCYLKPGDSVNLFKDLVYSKSKIKSVRKIPRRFAYRLRTTTRYIDTFPSVRFKLTKKGRLPFIRRLGEIKSTFGYYGLDKKGILRIDKFVSILQDPSKVRFYEIDVEPKEGFDFLVVNGYMLAFNQEGT